MNREQAPIALAAVVCLLLQLARAPRPRRGIPRLLHPDASRVSARPWSLVAVGCLLTTVAGPAPARGQCQTRDQVEALLHSARDHARCNDRLLRTSRPGRCPKAANPPGCARDVVAQAIALAYGPNNPPVGRVDRRSLRSQLGCQKAIGRAVSTFVATTLRQRLNGHRRGLPEAAALRLFDQLVARCDVTVAQDDSGVVVPAVGSPCEGTVGGRGSRVDAEA